MDPSCCREGTRSPSSSETIPLRVMKTSDVPQVRALHASLLPVSYPPAFFVQLLLNPRHLCLVAVDEGTVIGFASAAIDVSQPQSFGTWRHETHSDGACSDLRSDIPRSHVTLLTLGVLPPYQRKGIGRSLVHGVVRCLQASSSGLQSYQTVPHEAPSKGGKPAVLVRAQVAHSNTVGKCFYTHLGMMGQWVSDDPRLHFGLGARTSVVAGVLSI
ncbi:acyl-CoA N-acyltransferase [Melanogaster broomeanus]|nr:acyl-CoA N-acyltransferase [Melanogaster broomeanus]